MAEVGTVEKMSEAMVNQTKGVTNEEGILGPFTQNHQPSISEWETVKAEEYDDESPLEKRIEGPGDRRVNVDSDPGSPPMEESLGGRGGIPSPPILLPHGRLHHGAMPLIILPVQSEGMPSSGGLPLGRGNPSSPPTPPQGEELKKVLIQQLEYYFSKDNLSSDKYLLSQMDGYNFVPVSVISNFNQVKRLTADMTLILEALRESSVLQLDEREEKVRAIPEKRCVLILREIPKETPKEDIVSLFSHKKCPSCVTCEFADNDCWYVTFDSEESTQQAFSYLREEVRQFLGQPIRARIKGTTVQRSSGMPKSKHIPFTMQYNGAPPQLPYYQAPPTLPWSPTPPTSSTSPFFDPSNFHPYVGGNGFTPPQQTPPNQVGVAGQSSAGVQPGPGLVHGNRYSAFPYMAMVRGGEGDRGGRGRMGPPNRSHRNTVGERGQSPPIVSNGDVPGGMDRDKADFKTGRGSRDHGGSGIGGGVGGRFRYPDDRKIPRLKNTRHGGGGGREADKGADKSQLPPRQQNKQQPKLDLATAHFPPLPTSTSSENGTTPTSGPPSTTSYSHISTEDTQETLSDIVKRNTRPLTKEISSNGHVPVISSPNGLHSTAASIVVERNIASTISKVTNAELEGTITRSTLQESSLQDTPTTSAGQTNVTDFPHHPPLSYSSLHSKDDNVSESSSTVVTRSVVVTASSVVANEGETLTTPSSYPQSAAAAVTSRPAPPPSTQAKPLKSESKGLYKDKQYGNTKGYNRYSDRDPASSKQNRNSQVLKADSRTAPTASNARNRYKPDKELQRSRPANGSRPPHTKPSPKSFKKNFPPNPTTSPQVPPPPTVPSSANSTPIDENNQVSLSDSQSGVASVKPERPSYAQMAQKKKNDQLSKTSVQDQNSTLEVGGRGLSPPTPPQSGTATPSTNTQSNSSKMIKSASNSSGSLSVGQPPGSATIASKSAPTSPTKELGGVVGGRGDGLKAKESEI